MVFAKVRGEAERRNDVSADEQRRLGKSRWTESLAFLKSHYFDKRRPPAVLTTPAKANWALQNQSPFFEISWIFKKYNDFLKKSMFF